MRPALLNKLFAGVTSIGSIGDKTAKILSNINITKTIDLLFHFPVAVVDRSKSPAMHEMQQGDIVTIKVFIEKHEPPSQHNKSIPYRIICRNDSGYITVTYFRPNQKLLESLFPLNHERVISGKVEFYNGKPSIIHPDYVSSVAKSSSIEPFEPIYNLTKGLSNRNLIRFIKNALQHIVKLNEWIDSTTLKLYEWPSWNDAISILHKPTSALDIALESKARSRLAYDEFFAQQLALKIIRIHNKQQSGIAKQFDGNLKQALISLLSFELTEGQKNILSDVESDMKSNKRMTRLIHGDVGSGKTIIALISMLNAVEAGYQAMIMAPTEILARQHFEYISKVTKALNLTVTLLCGAMKIKEKRQALEEISTGQANIIIGTHALFQEKTNLNNLGLVVIDEQHRFGVEQRLSLINKGRNIDTILMSATPIPRTLAMIIYGDMDCSILTEKPKNRKPIITNVMHISKIPLICDRLKTAFSQNNKAYWICPLIEDSESLSLSAVESRYEDLKKIFGNEIALIHGKIKPQERDVIMTDFKNGKYKLVIATTVIEVGVDVSDATIIIIENSENFGLSQLHQLRGRVGRGDKQSSCILLYDKLTKNAKKRLQIMRQSNDGFYLAEQDLLLRGSGEVLGTKQSGLPDYKIASLPEHYDILKRAASNSDQIIKTNPKLLGDDGNNLRNLLYLFEYDKEIKYISA